MTIIRCTKRLLNEIGAPPTDIKEYAAGKIYGPELSYFETGELKSKIYYSESKKSGIATWYFKNGEISAYCKYQDDKMDGRYYSYYINGMLKSEAEYDNGIPLSQINYNEEGGKISSSNAGI